MKGMLGDRSNLIQHVFRVYDTLDHPDQLGSEHFFCHDQISFHAARWTSCCLSRSFLLLENVQNILSTVPDIRRLLHYVIQAGLPHIRISVPVSDALDLFRRHVFLKLTCQECQRRKLEVQWCTTKLHNVGLAVHASTSKIHGVSSQETCFKAGRARVFFLCSRPGQRVFKDRVSRLSHGSAFLLQCVLQDLPVRPLNSFLMEPWNIDSRPPMFKWLQTEQSDSDKARLRMMGNLVVPRMASLAIQVLASMQPESA